MLAEENAADTLYRSIQSTLESIHNVIHGRNIGDAQVLLEELEKTLNSSETLISADAHVASAVWAMVCGSSSSNNNNSNSSSAQKEKLNNTSLLVAVQSLRNDVSASNSTSDARVLKRSLSLLLFVLQPPYADGASATQLQAVRDTAWLTLQTFHRLGKHTEVQAECLWVLAAIAAFHSNQNRRDRLTETHFGVADVLHVCIQIGSKTTAAGLRLKSAALQVLGTLCRTYPVAVAASSRQLLDCFQQVAKRLTQQAEVEQVLGEGFFLGITDYLSQFPLSTDDERASSEEESNSSSSNNKAFALTLHHMVKGALLLADVSTNYRFCKSALRFLKHHADSTLSESLYRDAESFFSILQGLWEHKNIDVHREAYSAAASFLQTLARQLVMHAMEGHHPANGTPNAVVGAAVSPQSLLERLLDKLEGVLREPSSSRSQLTFALVAYGYMAQPIVSCFDSDALLVCFERLVSKCSTLIVVSSNATSTDQDSDFGGGAINDDVDGGMENGVPTNAARTSSLSVPLASVPEDVVRLLPQLLTAFAFFVWELPVLPASGVEAIVDLLHATLVLLPSDFFFQRLRVVVVPSVLKLLVALRRRPASYAAHVIVSFLCRRTLELVCPILPSSSSSSDADDGIALSTMPPVNFTTYTELWDSLLSTTRHKTAEWGLVWQEADLPGAQQHLQATMLDVAMEFLAGMDMGVVVSSTGQPASLLTLMQRGRDDGVDLRPRCMADYRAFLVFVDFYSSVAASLWHHIITPSVVACDETDTQQQPSAYAHNMTAWISHLVDCSLANAHVSGFYYLLHVILRLGKKYNHSAAALLSPAARTLLEKYFAVCLRRVHVYTDELLYQCAFTILVLSQWIAPPSQRDGGRYGHDASLLYPLQVVLTAPDAPIGANDGGGGGEANSGGMMVDKGRRAALNVLAQLIEESPSRAGSLLLPLITTSQVLEHAFVRQQLSELASRYGVHVARAASHGPAINSTDANAVADIPVWRLREELLSLPSSSGAVSLTKFPIGCIVRRVSHLSLHAESRKVRATAGELFHFIVTWLLGKGATSWYPDVFPVLCTLAASHEDGVPSQLFNDLLLQCTHWFASSPSASGAQHLEDALFDCLRHQEAAKRRAAVAALHEYICWCGKRGVQSNEEGARRQCRRVVQRLWSCLTCGDTWALLGASMLLHQVLEDIPRDDGISFLCADVPDWVHATVTSLRAALEDGQSDELGIVDALASSLRLVQGMLTESGSHAGATIRDHWSRQPSDTIDHLLEGLLHVALAAVVRATRSAADAVLDLFQLLCKVVVGNAHWLSDRSELLHTMLKLHAAAEEDGAQPGGVVASSILLCLALIKRGVLSAGTAGSDGGAVVGMKRRSEGATESQASFEDIQKILFPRLRHAFQPPQWDTMGIADKDAVYAALHGLLRYAIDADKAEVLLNDLGVAETFQATAKFLLTHRCGIASGKSGSLLQQVVMTVKGCSPQRRLEWQRCLMDQLQAQLIGLLFTNDASADAPLSLTFRDVQVLEAAVEMVFVMSCCSPDGNSSIWSELAKHGTSTTERCTERLKQLLDAATSTTLHRSQVRSASVSLVILLLNLGVTLQDVLTILRPYLSSDLITMNTMGSRLSTGSLGAQQGGASTGQNAPESALSILSAVLAVVAARGTNAAGVVLLLAMVRDLCAMAKILPSPLDNEEEEEEDDSTEMLCVPLLRTSLRLLRRNYQPGEQQQQQHSHLATILAGILPTSADASADKVKLKLQVLCALLSMDGSALLSSSSGTRGTLELLSAACSVSRWGGRANTMLANTIATELFVMAARVYEVALSPSRAALRGERSAISLMGSSGGSDEQQQQEWKRLLVDQGSLTVKTIISEELPLDWKELQVETVQYTNYRRVVRALTRMAGAMTPIQPDALLLLVPLLALTDLPESEEIAAIVDSALRRLSADQLLALCRSCVDLQKGALPRQMWWAATYRITLPALRALPASMRCDFFSQNVRPWLKEAQAVPLVGFHKPTNAFILFECMYRLTDGATLKGPINSAFVGSGATNTGKELTVALIKACGAARTYAASPSAMSTSPDAEDDVLNYRQSSYRCLASVLMATQDQETVFVKLLLDGDKADNWNRLADLRPWGDLPVESDFSQVPEVVAKESSDWELRSRHKLNPSPSQVVAEDDHMAEDYWLTPGAPSSQVGSRSLRAPSSTIPQQYGWSQHALSPATAMNPVDVDRVWECTCSGALFTLVDFLRQRFPGFSTDAVQPAWVREIKKILTSRDVHLHVKLVWVRVIQLRQEYFSSYGDILAEVLLSAVSDAALGPALHYIAREVTCMVMDWCEKGDVTLSHVASRALMEYTLRAAPRCDSSFVSRSNVELLRHIYTQVHKGVPCLTSPDITMLLQGSPAEAHVGVQMCGVVLYLGNSLTSLGTRTDSEKLHEALLHLLGTTEEAMASAEVIGLELSCLKAAAEGAPTDTSATAAAAGGSVPPAPPGSQPYAFLLQGTERVLQRLWTQRISRALRVLRAVEENAPDILASFLPGIFFADFIRRPAEDQLLQLDILSSSLELAAGAYDTIQALLSGSLDMYTDAVRVAIYELLVLLVPRVAVASRAKMAHAFLNEAALQTFARCENSRAVFFRLAVTLQKLEPIPAVHHMIVSKGLLDSCAFVQDVCLEYIDLHSAPQDVTERAAYILNAASLSTTAESDTWLRHAAILSLSPYRRSPACADSTYLFSKPLAQCQFTPRPSLSLWGSTTMSSRQVPLFSQTLGTAAGLPGAAFGATSAEVTYVGASQRVLGGGDPSAAASMAMPRTMTQQQQQHHAGGSRMMAPQPLLRRRGQVGNPSLQQSQHAAQFTTVDLGGAAASTPSQLQSAIVFTRQEEASDGAQVPSSSSVYRRLRALTQSAKNLKYMATSARQRRERAQREKQWAAQRRQQLIVFREYRDGDVPDIQVSLLSFITPLQALCLHDTQIASTVSVHLLTSVYDAVCAPPRQSAATVQQQQQPATTANNEMVGSGASLFPYFAATNASPGVDASHAAPLRQSLVSFLRKGCCAPSASPLMTNAILELFLLYQWRDAELECVPSCDSLVSRLGQTTHNIREMKGAGATAILIELAIQKQTALSLATNSGASTDVAVMEAPAKCPEAMLWMLHSKSLKHIGETELSLLSAQQALIPEDAAALQTITRSLRQGATSIAGSMLMARLAEHKKEGDNREVFVHLQRAAARSLLEWDTLYHTFSTADGGSIGTIELPQGAVERELLFTSAIRQNPSAIAGMLEPLQDQYPAAWSAMLLQRQDWPLCVQYIQRVLPRTVFTQKDYRLAHHLHAMLRAASLLQQVSRSGVGDNNDAIDAARTFLTHIPLTGEIECPQDLDQILWVRRVVCETIQTSLRENFFTDDLSLLVKNAQVAQLNLCNMGCDAILSVPEYNGAVKQLLLRANEGVSADLGKELWTTAARASMYRALFSMGYTDTSSSPTALLDRLRQAVEEKKPSLRVTEQHRLDADGAWCALHMQLQKKPLNTAALVREADILSESVANINHSDAAQDAMLLDALDHILSAHLSSVDDENDEEGDQSSGKSATAAGEGITACWFLYTRTLVRCLECGTPTVSQASASSSSPRERIPRLLQIFDLKAVDATTCSQQWKDLLQQVEALPPRVWVAWASQLLNALLRTRHPTVATVLVRLAAADPQAVYFSYRCASEEVAALEKDMIAMLAAQNNTNNNDSGARRLHNSLNELRATLSDSPQLSLVREFAEELYRLHNPDQRLRAWLLQVHSALRDYEAQRTEALYNKAQALFLHCVNDCMNPSRYKETEKVNHSFAVRAASYRDAFLNKSGKLIDNCKGFATAMMHVTKNVKPQQPAVPEDYVSVTAYSERLSQLFADGHVTQAARAAAPRSLLVPRQAVTLLHNNNTGVGACEEDADQEWVTGMEDVMRVMPSIQKPKRIVLLGTRTSHVYMVKGGDDLRLDQRIQEIFSVCNALLSRERSGDGRHHRIRTFSVVPVSPHVGLVEWVPNTRELGSILDDKLTAMSGSGLTTHPAAAQFAKTMADQKSYLDSYKTRKNRDGSFSQWFDSVVRMVPPRALEAGLMDIAPDRCQWFEVRRRFTSTHAVVSLASYLLGIGDRHLSNFLVDVLTGDAISIDYGHAFGSATRDLQIPELMPFRFTQQIQAVQGALGNAVARLTMHRTLHTLRSQRSVIEGLVAAFVSEPLQQWKTQGGAAGPRMAKARLMSVYRKLNLEDPCDVLMDDVKHNRAVREAGLVEEVRAVVLGTPQRRPTVHGGDNNEEEEGQGIGGGDAAQQEEAFVDCLISIATDSNVLGRTWIGWRPFF